MICLTAHHQLLQVLKELIDDDDDDDVCLCVCLSVLDSNSSTCLEL